MTKRYSILSRIFSTTPFQRRRWIWALAMFLCFIWFDIEWCMATTFTSFSRAETYVNAAAISLLLSMPILVWGRRWIQGILLAAVCVWLECNLIYSRTYFNAIPLESYVLAGNLSDFTSSVTDSLRLADIGFPLIFILAVIFGRTPRSNTTIRRYSPRRASATFGPYMSYLLSIGIVATILLAMRGGLRQAWEDLENCHHHSMRVPMYTVAGSLIHDYLTDSATPTDADRAMVRNWLDNHMATTVPDSLISHHYSSVVIVMCESLESWPIGLTLEGKEITPNLNKLVADSTTLYVPHVVSQVGPGRSIDAQLIINAGMLPMERGVYSMKVPFNRYYTLNHALAERGGRNYLLTVDKPVVWNQAAVASSFGVDTLLTKQDWVMEEQAGGYRLKLGDRSFLRQVTEKMRAGEVFPEGKPALVQLVTYSGHNPFILNEELDNLRLEGDYPEVARRYLTVAHYTDEGLGILLDYLQSRSDYDRTLVVITGDHEGLADYRTALASQLPYVNPRQHVPLIIANAPRGGRHDSVVGQIDIYPTLLHALGFDSYPWHGMGTDILSPSHPGVAVNSYGALEGDTTSLAPAIRNSLLNARKVSDRILRYNLLESHNQ